MMPPPDSHRTVTPEQKAKLKQWITEGAVYQPHWAFLPPVTAIASSCVDNGHGPATRSTTLSCTNWKRISWRHPRKPTAPP